MNRFIKGLKSNTSMTVAKTNLDGVLKITLDIFEDHRGQYIETYNKEVYRNAGIDIEFVTDDISVSSKHVLRGIHGDNETWKLISCLHGKIYLVVVNCDTDSADFGKWESFTLSESNGLQVLIPPKYGVGHLILTDKAIFHYKQSSYYNPSKQFTYRYDEFGIWWPLGDQKDSMWAVSRPILSRRDEEGRYV